MDLDAVAQNTPGFSGADLANLVNEAALSATRKRRATIAADDFTEAFDKIVLGDLREAKLDPKEKRRVAVHESGHAVMARFSAHAEPLTGSPSSRAAWRWGSRSRAPARIAT